MTAAAKNSTLAISVFLKKEPVWDLLLIILMLNCLTHHRAIVVFMIREVASSFQELSQYFRYHVLEGYTHRSRKFQISRFPGNFNPDHKI